MSEVTQIDASEVRLCGPNRSNLMVRLPDGNFILIPNVGSHLQKQLRETKVLSIPEGAKVSMSEEPATTVPTSKVKLYDNPEAKQKVNELISARAEEEIRIEALARAAEQANLEKEKRKSALEAAKKAAQDNVKKNGIKGGVEVEVEEEELPVWF